jgi:Ca-activated chloride channel family protein
MSDFAAFHFLRPLWLLALLPAVLLWWAHRRQADTTRRWRGAIDADLLRHLVVGGRTGGWLRPVDAMLATWVVAAIMVAGPAWQREPSPFAADAPPVMIVLRVTPSMETRDLQPSRLERAQQKIADLLSQHQGQAAGLIAYAGSAHLVLPPTRDADVVTTMARALSPDVMPKQGDDLTGAIALAQSVLADGGQGGSILLMADEAAPLTARPQTGVPIRLLAMLPPGRDLGGGLSTATRDLGATVQRVTIDTADVAAIGRELAQEGRNAPDRGGVQRWRDAGWYLLPVLACIVLLWFRRGWGVPI